MPFIPPHEMLIYANLFLLTFSVTGTTFEIVTLGRTIVVTLRKLIIIILEVSVSVLYVL